MLPHETTSVPEAFCCRALLRCWSLPIPRNWNTRSAWLKSRTRAGGFSGFLWLRKTINSSIVFLFCRSYCDLPVTMQPCQNWLRGRSLPQKLEDTGGAQTNLRELPREFHHSIIWKAMENQHNQSMPGAREAAGCKSLHQMLAKRMIFQSSSSTELITCDENPFRLLFPADLQCGFGPILEGTWVWVWPWQHDVLHLVQMRCLGLRSLLECCLISHAAWRMIFQSSSSTELITCDENLFRLLFPADLQCGFGPILEGTWQHDVLHLVQMRCLGLRSLLECCLISHAAWRMIFQSSSSTELITCDENLFRLLFPADLQHGFGPILEGTWEHDVLHLVQMRCLGLRSLLECCLISHAAWRMIFQSSSSTELITCDEHLFRLLFLLICSVGLALFFREHDSKMCCIWCRWGA